MRRLFTATLLASTFAFAFTPAAHSASPPWAAAPYSYYAKNTKLATVLKEFAGNFSLSLQISDQVQGTVHGNLQAQSPTEFLDRLASVYGLTWFTHAGTLYINRNTELSTTAISSGGNSIASVREALTSLGILDARFGWGELAEQGIAMISGPPPYVALVEKTMAALPSMAGGQRVAVFKLKHASVNDRVILYRDRQITTPGLAQVLRNLVGIQNTSGSGVQHASMTSVAFPTQKSAAADTAMAPNPGDASPPAPGAVDVSAQTVSLSRQRVTPSIQADPRLNAIIIQDTPERIPLYQALIEQLDQPTPLIEIEAMIIDINSSRLDELGISWSGRKGGTVGGFGNMTPSADGNDLVLGALQRTASINPSTLLVDAGNNLIARIRALESQGEAYVQSRPSILTIDNIGALLDLSETFYIRSVGERVATVTPVTAGTTLRVTPHFIQHGEQPVIQLDIDIEDGQIQAAEVVDALPIVRRSVVSTQAIVGEGQTLLIGGYKNTQKFSDNQRVPGIGQVPVVGWLFSSKSKTHQSSERLFMIKPRLVGLSEQAYQALDALQPFAPPISSVPSPHTPQVVSAPQSTYTEHVAPASAVTGSTAATQNTAPSTAPTAPTAPAASTSAPASLRQPFNSSAEFDVLLQPS